MLALKSAFVVNCSKTVIITFLNLNFLKMPLNIVLLNSKDKLII